MVKIFLRGLFISSVAPEEIISALEQCFINFLVLIFSARL